MKKVLSPTHGHQKKMTRRPEILKNTRVEAFGDSLHSAIPQTTTTTLATKAQPDTKTVAPRKNPGNPWRAVDLALNGLGWLGVFVVIIVSNIGLSFVLIWIKRLLLSDMPAFGTWFVLIGALVSILGWERFATQALYEARASLVQIISENYEGYNFFDPPQSTTDTKGNSHER